MARKGGVGKSFLARSLAVQAAIAGKRCAVIDADPQGTLEKWSKRRESPVPAVVSLQGRTLADTVAWCKGRGSEITFIDTPPHDQPIINLAAQVATYCLIVTEPAAESLEQIGSVVSILRSLNKPAGIVINKANPKSLAFAAARGALTSFGLPACPYALTSLLVHQYSGADGQTAQERDPDGKGATELASVWGWLANEIKSPEQPKKGRK